MISTVKLEAEILATILYDGKGALAAVPDLSVSDFTLGDHKAIFRTIAELEAEGNPANEATVGALISSQKTLDTLHALPPPFITSGLPYQVKLLKTCGALTKAKALAGQIMAIADAENPVAVL